MLKFNAFIGMIEQMLVALNVAKLIGQQFCMTYFKLRNILVMMPVNPIIRRGI